MQSDLLNMKRAAGRSPRMTCTVCMKPNAVRYYIRATVSGEKVTKMIYEHRDEPPESWRTWKGKKIPVYRRCHAGIVKHGLPLLKDKNSPESNDETLKDYKIEFAESLSELRDIAYDITGEDAKRILKNIWRWLEHKQKELRDE